MSEQVQARILLWGIQGAGKVTTLTTIHSKLQAESRGEIRFEPTPIDPTVRYPALPISLGRVGGVDCRLELIAVPSGEEQALTRKQLLDGIDGIILVIDASPDQIEKNGESIEELRSQLAAYGRSLEECPVVLQYNKRDVADPFAIEDLHRRIGLDKAAVFETIATTGHGVLPTLTTISKHVMRASRSQAANEASQVNLAAAPAVAEDASAQVLEAALVTNAGADASHSETAETLDLQAEELLGPIDAEKPKQDDALQIVSAGQAEVGIDGELRVPLVLGDAEGCTRTMTLRLRLDAQDPGGSD